MIYRNIFQSFLVQPNIFNISFAAGIFPEKLKFAKIISVYKKNSKLECSCYIPISLLSNIDKILEKLMYNKLLKFLSEQKILYLKQVCFRKNCSTAHAIINRIDSMENAFDKNKFPCWVFIDLKKSPINKTLNKDLRELSFLFNANIIALNVAKTEIFFLKQA